MIRRRRPVSIAGLAGLALSATASAQYAIVTSQPGTFTDISTSGTPVGNGDDNTFSFTTAIGNGLFPAGTIYVCTNGFMASGATNPGAPYSNDVIPSVGMPTGFTSGDAGYLLPFWDDLQSTSDANSEIYRQEIGGVLIVQWNNYGHYSSVTGQTITFEVKVFPGPNPAGGIYAQFIYQDTTFGGTYGADNGASATVGYVGNGSTTGNISWSFNQAVITPATVISFVVAGTGACCMPDGSCQILATNLCSAQGGAYRGDNTVCAGQNCPQPGACCLPGGSCSIFGSGQCAALSGVYEGDNSVCGSVVCPQPGACCTGDGMCQLLNSTQCAATSGTYHGNGSACSNTTCPVGACCLTLNSIVTCALTSLSGCTSQSGVYRGDGTGCATAACPGNAGPDVWVANLTDVSNFGAVGSITAYAVGTNACNMGASPANWYSSTNRHPAIAQNMYRLKAGRFEQIGQSWLKHGFASTNGGGCGTCQQPPGGGSQLGVQCSDAYGSGLNGDQDLLGPRSQVNGTTGVYPYPFTAPGYSTAIDRRLQVFTTDVIPAQNPGALYFVDAYYKTQDDSQWNNALNSITYSQVLVPSEIATPTFTGTQHTLVPGIQAWKDQDASVTLATADYVENAITARFCVAAKATNNGNGTWHYEYAVYNHNANRDGGTFAIPVGPGVAITNIGFHAPFSHSGEPFDNSPWTPSVAGGSVTWSTTPYAANVSANAIRWGTLYNFRFDASTAPTTGAATLGLFVPGTPSALTVTGLPIPGLGCYANCDGSTTPPILNVQDFACFLNKFAGGDSYANCDQSTTPPVLNVLDFSCFLNKYASGCS